MKVTVIKEYNGKQIVKSSGLYYIVDSTDKSLTNLVGYSTIKDLVIAECREEKVLPKSESDITKTMSEPKSRRTMIETIRYWLKHNKNKE